MTSAIILCAGKSTRLQSELRGRPKWMIEVRGIPVLQHLVNGLHKAGIFRTLVLRSHFFDTAKTPSVSYKDDVETTNMLATLMSASEEIRGELIICYGDILVEPRLIDAMASSSADVGVLVDRSWINLFRHRADDPVSIAESCSYANDHLSNIGQKIIGSGDIPLAQFIGLIRLSPKGSEIWTNVYRELKQNFSGVPWRNASTFERAYTTDFLQELIDRGYKVSPIVVSGGWIEFDTPRDLEIPSTIEMDGDCDIFDFNSLDRFPSVASAGGVALKQRDEKIYALLVGSGKRGEWRIPKGMLLPGEDVKAAAVREFQEETGVVASVMDYLETAEWDYVYANSNWHERCVFYSMSCSEQDIPTPDSEHEVAAWIDISRPDEVMKYSAEGVVIRIALLRYLGKV